jgi:hypothetical protein
MKYFLKKFPEAWFQVPPAHHNPIYLYSFVPGSKYNAHKKKSNRATTRSDEKSRGHKENGRHQERSVGAECGPDTNQ